MSKALNKVLYWCGKKVHQSLGILGWRLLQCANNLGNKIFTTPHEYINYFELDGVYPFGAADTLLMFSLLSAELIQLTAEKILKDEITGDFVMLNMPLLLEDGGIMCHNILISLRGAEVDNLINYGDAQHIDFNMFKEQLVEYSKNVVVGAYDNPCEAQNAFLLWHKTTKHKAAIALRGKTENLTGLVKRNMLVEQVQIEE